jgi:histidyl-tRNA synthetase
MANVKGTYDFVGATQALRRRVQTVMREVFELYDFDEMESTILTDLDILTSKYAGGDEILKEMYTLVDQGGRELGLRYDLTIPFAKVIAEKPGMELPYRRYEMGKVFRDGPVKRGRLREFLQCDVDVVGAEGPEIEAELMLIATEVFSRLGIPIVLRWNNRLFLAEVLASIGVPAEEWTSVMLTLDKIAKIGEAGIVQELCDKGLDAAVICKIVELAGMEQPSFAEVSLKFGVVETRGAEEVLALQRIIDRLELGGVCVFDPFLSRGLSFYTGTVYEIFDANNEYASSLGGGGRYDKIIAKLIGRDDRSYQAVGLSFGMESIMEMLKDRPAEPALPAVIVLPIGDTAPEALKTAAMLRSSGIRTAVETGRRKLKKSLATAAVRGIRYVILIGTDEVADGKVMLKDMKEAAQALVSMEEAVGLIVGKK